MTCKICGNPAEPFARAQLRCKYDVQYYACSYCEFVQTEAPYWLEEAYATPILRSDVGYVSRNVMLAKITKAMILAQFSPEKRFLDYGGGYGMLVRLMRDAGFDFYRSDKFCENLFASDFEAESAGRTQYELLTSFEVFEHLPDPMAELQQMLSYSRNIFFSTELQPRFKLLPAQWHYYALHHGQHVSFYSRRTLEQIASSLNMKLYTDGRFLHLLTDKIISPWLFQLLLRSKVAGAIHLLVRRQSLGPGDFEKAISIPI